VRPSLFFKKRVHSPTTVKPYPNVVSLKELNDLDYILGLHLGLAFNFRVQVMLSRWNLQATCPSVDTRYLSFPSNSRKYPLMASSTCWGY
jgi:hypothetical protein